MVSSLPLSSWSRHRSWISKRKTMVDRHQAQKVEDRRWTRKTRGQLHIRRRQELSRGLTIKIKKLLLHSHPPSSRHQERRRLQLRVKLTTSSHRNPNRPKNKILNSNRRVQSSNSEMLKRTMKHQNFSIIISEFCNRRYILRNNKWGNHVTSTHTRSVKEFKTLMTKLLVSSICRRHWMRRINLWNLQRMEVVPVNNLKEAPSVQAIK
jgi:hypothetical protein